MKSVGDCFSAVSVLGAQIGSVVEWVLVVTVVVATVAIGEVVEVVAVIGIVVEVGRVIVGRMRGDCSDYRRFSIGGGSSSSCPVLGVPRC